MPNVDRIQCENELPPSENETADRQDFLADRLLGTADLEHTFPFRKFSIADMT